MVSDSMKTSPRISAKRIPAARARISCNRLSGAGHCAALSDSAQTSRNSQTNHGTEELQFSRADSRSAAGV